MSTLFMVRHAQASYLSDDYDRLSELGFAQARALGRHLSEQQRAIDVVFVGPRRRHRETAEALVAELPSAPRLEELGELDEYPADEVLRARLPALVSQRPDLQELVRDASSDDPRRRGRALDLLLQAALFDWAERDGDAGHESWREFRGRVERMLERVTEGSGSGRTLLAVSSAGTIGAATASVLGAAAGVALGLGFMLNNSALTELAFSAGRRGLVRFNVLSHLPEPAHWTRR